MALEINNPQRAKNNPHSSPAIAPAISAEFLANRQKLVKLGVLSDTVAGNPEAELDFQTEAAKFFQKMRNDDLRRSMLIEEFGDKINLSPNTRAIIVMPAEVKEEILKSTLENFSNQTNKDFEIAVIINNTIDPKNPDESKISFEQESAKRLEEINEVRKKHPWLKIHVVLKQYPKWVIGDVRAQLTEAVCLKAATTGIKDPIIIGNDADNIGVSPDYVHEIISQFDQSKDIDYVAGPVKYFTEESGPESYGWQCPELLISYRIHKEKNKLERENDRTKFAGASKKILRKYLPSESPYLAQIAKIIPQISRIISECNDKTRQKFIGLTGGNMSFRAGSYLASGGYDRKLTFAEDQKMTRRLREMRLQSADDPISKEQHHKYTEKAKMFSSPRRALQALLSGRSTSENSFSFNSMDGSQMNDADLAAKYQKTEFLIQKSDIEKAFHGDKAALNKIKKRMEFALRRNLIRSGINDPEFIAAILSGCSIATTTPPDQWKFNYKGHGGKFGRVIVSDDQLKGLEIDIEKTDLDYLYKYFNLK